MGSFINWKYDCNDWTAITSILVKRSLSFPDNQKKSSWTKLACFLISSVTSGTQNSWLQPSVSQERTGGQIIQSINWMLAAPGSFLLHPCALDIINHLRDETSPFFHETGLMVRCHLNASPKWRRRWRRWKASANWWLPPLLNCGGIYSSNTYWRMCEEWGSWIGTFLSELFLIHGGAITRKIAFPQYDAKGQPIFSPWGHFRFNYELLPLHKIVFETCSPLNSAMFCCALNAKTNHH